MIIVIQDLTKGCLKLNFNLKLRQSFIIIWWQFSCFIIIKLSFNDKYIMGIYIIFWYKKGQFWWTLISNE